MLGYDWTRLHAALNDLPAALLLVAAIFELLALTMRKESFRVVSFWTLMVGAIGGVAAVLTGLKAEGNIEHGDAVHRVMETHEILAFITLGIFAVLAIWRIWRERRMGATERALVLAFTLGGTGVLIATAVYGGRLVFDHAAGIPTEVLAEESEERSQGHQHGAGADHGGDGHGHQPAPASGDTSAVPTAGDHVDPPGTPPHTHEPTKPSGHSHPPGTPEHAD
jgi:uncharacterized membrane protein